MSDSAKKSECFFSRGIHCAVSRSGSALSDCSPQAKVGKVPLCTNIARVFPEAGELSTADIAAVCPVSCSTKYSNVQNIICFIVNELRCESVHKLLPVLEVKHVFLFHLQVQK